MLRKLFIVLIQLLTILTISANEQATPRPRHSGSDEITPIPIDKTDPHIKVFHHLDSNNDGTVTFTEFLLADKPYIERKSNQFHMFDKNQDNIISREEFQSHFRKMDEQRGRDDFGRADFFRRLNHFDGPFFNNEQELSSELTSSAERRSLDEHHSDADKGSKMIEYTTGKGKEEQEHKMLAPASGPVPILHRQPRWMHFDMD